MQTLSFHFNHLKPTVSIANITPLSGKLKIYGGNKAAAPL
jgi:hypothetical protein